MTIKKVRQIFASHAPGVFTAVMVESGRLSAHTSELMGLYRDWKKGEDLEMNIQHCGEGRYIVREGENQRFLVSGLEENSVYIDVSNKGSSADFNRFHKFLYIIKDLGEIKNDDPLNWD